MQVYIVQSVKDVIKIYHDRREGERKAFCDIMEKREERVMDKKISGYRMLRSRKEYSGKEDAETDGFAADSSG
ncbi:hypothetical protein DWY69_11660 [Eisenbergiella massiliensis]|uniref:Uncharacterized protein n=1 Tax=Eisenbergiella massiliensis TaxID=1720294 RepID=A0A3E3IXU6_9FIRM|nr:hypothetical protein DWY69_11660 [Eisenbergiella massiliensis]